MLGWLFWWRDRLAGRCSIGGGTASCDSISDKTIKTMVETGGNHLVSDLTTLKTNHNFQVHPDTFQCNCVIFKDDIIIFIVIWGKNAMAGVVLSPLGVQVITPWIGIDNDIFITPVDILDTAGCYLWLS